MDYIELYIESNLVDLEPNQRVAQTFQINTFFDVSDRQANFTNRFTIPNTPRNSEIFNRLGIVGNKTRIAYKSLNANLSINGIPLIINGTANIKQYKDASGYEVFIYSGVNSIFEALEDRNLSDLDFSDLNHVLNTTTFAASLNNTDGYIYALYDTGQHISGQPIVIDQLLPCVFVHTLFDKIFTQAGFTYSGDVFTDDDFLEKLVTPNNMYLPVDTSSTSNIVFAGQSIRTIGFNGLSVIIPFIGNDPNNVLSFNGGLIEVPETKQYTINITVDADISDTRIDGFYNFQILVNDSAIGAVNLLQSGLPQSLSIPVFLNEGDSLTMQLQPARVLDTPDPEDEVPIEFETIEYDIDFELRENNVDTNINFNQLFLEGTTQVDFIKDVLQKFGLLLRRTPNSNNYEFIRVRNLLSDRSNAVNFEELFIKRNSQAYLVPDIAQTNKFQYQYGEDEAPFADGSIFINNEIIPKERVAVLSATTASRLTQKVISLSDEKLYGTAFFVPDDGGSFSRQAPGMYMFDLNIVDTSIRYQNEGGAPITRSGDTPFASFLNLPFPIILQRYYEEYAAIINSPIREEIELNLDVLAVYNFDFFKLIYIPQLGHYYYVEKIKNFIAGRPTKLDVVQISEFPVGAPTVGDRILVNNYNTNYVFDRSDFTLLTTPPYFSPDGTDFPDRITIESLPEEGELTNFGIPMTIGEQITGADLDDSFIQYEPGANNFPVKTVTSVDTVGNTLTLAETDADIPNAYRVNVDGADLPEPLQRQTTYYVINSATSDPGIVALAETEADALANIRIDLTTPGSGSIVLTSGDVSFTWSATNPSSFRSSNIANFRIFFF